jgi:type 1 glutamine amidotransferase
LAAPLFTAFDANKDGSVTRAELKAAFGAWYAAADSGNAGSATQAQLTTALGAVFPPPPPADPAAPGAGGGGGGRGGRGFGPFVAGATTPGLNEKCGGRSQTPTQACPEDIEKMMAALPAAAPAKPARPHKVLAWSRIPSAGFQHSSIPLAVKAIEELGKKTGAWTTDVSWDPAVFTAANLKQYDAIFLSSTTGCFLDMAPEADTPEERAISKKTTEERRAAFLEFVRSGKGVAGIHATGDSYHSACPNDEPTAGGGRGGFGRGGGAGSSGQVSSIILRWSWGLNEAKLQKNELTLTRADMEAVSDGWYNELDPEKSGKVSQADFTTRFAPIATQIGAAGRDNGRGSWLDWDNMIGGWFKFHWNDPQKITVKIDDKKSPLTKMFAGGADFDVNDETYTFSVNSFSRENVHVLTSINYDKMSFIDKLKESNPRPDHDFGLSWIRKDGQGRLFYMALGHNERIYAMKPMMEHLLAGMQYALGDLKADDSPSVKGSAKKTASK